MAWMDNALALSRLQVTPTAIVHRLWPGRSTGLAIFMAELEGFPFSAYPCGSRIT
jgi:hypothetical protein